MADISDGMGGGFSGKVGNLTFFKRKGKYYVRQSITESTSNSPKQKKQRSKFATAIMQLKPLSKVFMLGFDRVAKEGATGYNAGISYNMKHAMVIKDEEYEVDWSLVVMSQGTLPNVKEVSIEGNTQEGFAIEWNPNEVENGAKGSDCVNLIWREVDEKNGLCTIGRNQVKVLRRNGRYEFMPSSNMEGKRYFFYVFTNRAESNLVSDSAFLGEFAL